MDAVSIELAASDEDLIRSYQQSNARDLLDELANRHLNKIRAMVRSMVLEDELANDVTQDVFLRAFRSLHSFNGQSKFSTWLYRIAMNSIYSHLERKIRSPVTFNSALSETANSTISTHDESERQELEREIELALMMLSPKLRAAIVLSCLQGKSTSEAADIEGCTTATMYWRIHVARKQLKHHLADYLQ